ncbi:hypothetical protein Aab01nite_06730 [Paractinoplanes abujensis]|nr:hypothetical protein Aab01nite_06730 [Actinoplanes abujensis]
MLRTPVAVSALIVAAAPLSAIGLGFVRAAVSGAWFSIFVLLVGSRRQEWPGQGGSGSAG